MNTGRWPTRDARSNVNGPDCLMGRLKRLAEAHPALRFTLVPLRAKIALSYYTGRLGTIARWLLGSREYTNFSYEYTSTNLAYLAQTLALVTGCPVATVRDFLAEPTENGGLARTVRERIGASAQRAVVDPHMRLGKQRVWYALTRALQPRRVVEAGAGLGLAAVVIAEALRRNAAEGHPGEYLGIDRDSGAGALVGPSERDVARFIHGDSVSTLAGLQQPVDLFITDTHVSAELEYAECRSVEPWLTERAVIATTLTARLPAFAEETGRSFLAFKEEPREHWYPGGWIGLAFRR